MQTSHFYATIERHSTDSWVKVLLEAISTCISIPGCLMICRWGRQPHCCVLWAFHQIHAYCIFSEFQHAGCSFIGWLYLCGSTFDRSCGKWQKRKYYVMCLDTLVEPKLNSQWHFCQSKNWVIYISYGWIIYFEHPWYFWFFYTATIWGSEILLLKVC